MVVVCELSGITGIALAFDGSIMWGGGVAKDTLACFFSMIDPVREGAEAVCNGIISVLSTKNSHLSLLLLSLMRRIPSASSLIFPVAKSHWRSKSMAFATFTSTMQLEMMQLSVTLSNSRVRLLSMVIDYDFDISLARSWCADVSVVFGNFTDTIRIEIMLLSAMLTAGEEGLLSNVPLSLCLVSQYSTFITLA